MYTKVKTKPEIKAMRESGRLLATVLATLKQAVSPGMTTKDLAEIAKRELRGTGGQPAFLGYYGFPDVLCTSVNSAVVHGIPNTTTLLENGDILSMDFGVTYEGMITDSAVTVTVGSPRNKEEENLVKDTERALLAGIRAVHGGVHIGDIAHAIQEILERESYGIVRDLVGHGVGHELHEDPNIPNFGKAGTGPVLLAGMTVAIEPMATLGSHNVYTDGDDWTILTQDGSMAAHFEHTILVTESGAEILTTL